MKNLTSMFNRYAKAVVLASAMTASAFFGTSLHAADAPKEKDVKENVLVEKKSYNNSLGLSLGPIATWHWRLWNKEGFQKPEREDSLNERHFFAVARLNTENYGNWGLFTLLPNSQGNPGFGVMYSHPFITTHLKGGAKVEFSAAIGAVTGYESFPVPLLAGDILLTVPMSERADLTVDTGVAVYLQGLVFRSPSFGAAYRF